MTKRRPIAALAVLAALCAGAGYAFVTSGPSSADQTVLTGSGTSQVAGTSTGNGCTGNGGCSGNDNGDGGCSGVGNPNCNGGSTGGGNVKELGVAVGTVDGLYPGKNVDLPVTYTNPHSFDVNVSSYTVEAAVPEGVAAACPASNLAVPAGTITLSPRLNVAPHSSTQSDVPIGLRASAPDGCQNVTFSVTVTAWAVKK